MNERVPVKGREPREWGLVATGVLTPPLLSETRPALGSRPLSAADVGVASSSFAGLRVPISARGAWTACSQRS